MKKELPDTPLGRALALACIVIEKRQMIPILENVLISVRNDVMTFEATDLDIEVAVEVAGAELVAPISTTASAASLREIVAVRRVAAFTVQNGRLVVATIGGATYRLTTLPAQDFPRIKPFTPTSSFILPASQLLADLKAVRLFISLEETRYYLNGIYMHVTGDADAKDLRFAATDGHRLCRVVRPLPIGAENLAGTIIPRKAVKCLIAALEQQPADDEVQVEVGDCKVRFTLAGVTITTKAIDGTFPDYQRVVPTATSGTLKAKASDLAAAAEAGSAIMSERTRAVQFLFAGDDSTIRATSPENGEMTMPCPGEVSGSMPPSLGVNASYLVDSCAPFGDAVVNVGISEASAPVLLTSDEGEAKRLTIVQMPMRI